ncbi:hypothetical protein PV326_007084 [Microctonus aethiopoides]|nr:hypothetical protein PV326_007084 [Microctonus aethiopoides]
MAQEVMRRKRPYMDNDTKQTNKTIVPGPLLDQEEKAIEPGAGKPRVRYSSAARRRFKEEQRKLGAEQAQGTSAPELTDGGGGDGSKAQGSKRPAPEHDIPSPQSKSPDERSKLASGTYVQAATKIVRDGAAVVGCTDEGSGILLKSLFPDNKIVGKLIRVVQPVEHPKCHRVVFHVDEVISAREATALMDRQNPGLNAKGWVIVGRSEKKESTCSHFAALVDDRVMQACHSRPHCGVQRATVKPVENPRKKEEAAAAVVDK